MAEIVEREGYRVRVKVEVPAEKVGESYERVLAKYKARVRVPGFRPGRVPRKVLEARIGREALLEEVRELLVDESFGEAVRELGLSPVAARLVEGEVKEGEPFVYEIEVQNYPEVELPDWKTFELTASAPEITEDVVDSALEELRERYAEIEEVERPAEAGDVVVVATEQGELPVDLAKAPEAVVHALKGKAVGDTVTLPVFDESGEVSSNLEATIRSIKAVRRPELDDEFAKTLGFDTMEAARAKVREELEQRAEADAREARKAEFLDKLAEGLVVEIPPAMIDREIRAIWEEIAEDMAKKGVPFEDYLKQLEREGKFEEFKADIEKTAERRVRRGLAVERLIEALGTELGEEEWKAHLADLAQRYGLSVEDFEKAVGEDGLRRLYVRRLHDKALEEALKSLEAAS